MLDALRHSLRLIHAARVLARHDALFPFDLMRELPPALKLAKMIAGLRLPGERTSAETREPRPGIRLARALESLGPSFIKLGQALATRPDVVGVEVSEDLTELQDRLAPFPGPQARATIEEQFGQPIDALFTDFDDQPVAAASIAQVHFAVTTEGREVAVKVLRPDIEAAFERNLETYFWLARMIERAQPAAALRLRPVDVVRTLSQTVHREMDLRLEAAAASELKENMAGDSGIVIPDVDWSRTSRRVLTTARVSGIPIGDRAAIIAAGHDAAAIATKAVQVFLIQALRDGFFHADMHPGNLFVDANGDLVAVDFGIMGRLDRPTRRYLGEILLGFLEADYVKVARIHFEAGYVPRSHSVAAFAQALRSVGEPIFGRPVHEISLGRLLAQLFRVTEHFDMKTQPQLLLLQKTMVMVEGLANHLDSHANMWEISRPVIEGWVRESLGPEARLMAAAERTISLVARLPALIERLDEAGRGLIEDGLKLHPDSLDELARRQAERRRPLTAALWALVGVALILLLAG